MLITTAITRYLANADPTLGDIIARIGRIDITPHHAGFHTVARSIFHQSLSGAAAETILHRVLACAGCHRLTPEKLLALSDRELTDAGLSRPKIRYLRELAEAVQSGELSFRRLSRLPDDQVVRNLTSIKGIGAWTAEMYLIFVLNRPDVFPVLDAGIRTAMCDLYAIPRDRFKLDSPAIADRWRPYRSIASRYMWSHLNSAATD